MNENIIPCSIGFYFEENKNNLNELFITTGSVNDYLLINRPSSPFYVDTNEGNDLVEVVSSDNYFSGKIFNFFLFIIQFF